MKLQELLTASNLQSVAGLELLARLTVEGLLPGLQPSRQVGAGQEFSQFRSYQPGDDLRRLDWKLYARSDRFYVRESNIESNITIRFLIDGSASMLHQDHQLSKIDYIRYLVATLAWLGSGQGDHLELYAINETGWSRYSTPPGRQYFRRFLYELIQVKCAGQLQKAPHLHELPFQSGNRTLSIFLSDMYEAEQELQKLMARIRVGHTELLVFHILAKNELELNSADVYSLQDLETGQRIQLNAASRSTYQQNFNQFLAGLKANLLRQGISYEKLRMDEAVGPALRLFLQRRKVFRT